MSIIINVVSKSRSWIMSDGMARNSDTDAVVSTSLKKFELIHPKLCIGYTGCLEFAQETMRNFKSIYPQAGSANIEDASAAILHITSALREQTKLRAQFLVTGVSRTGCLGTITISNEGQYQILSPDGDDMAFAILGNQNSLDLGAYLQNQQGAPSYDVLIHNAMAEMIVDVSRIDPSVNQHTFFQIIEA